MDKSSELKTIAQKYGLTLIILFGSRARGHETPGSDTDLAVWVGNTVLPFNPDVRRRLYADLVDVMQTGNLDLVILNQATPLLQFQVAKTGIPLYEAPERFFKQFQVRAAKKHFDALPFYRLEKIYLNRKHGGLQNGGSFTGTAQTGQAAPIPGGTERNQPIQLS